VPVLSRTGNRPRNRLEGLQRDVILGRDEEDSCGAEGGAGEMDGPGKHRRKRPYAVANITHGTVTFLCAENSREAVDRCKVYPDDVTWYTTRIKPGITHAHDGVGRCIPKTYTTRQASKSLRP
jgi:hypothetical protein